MNKHHKLPTINLLYATQLVVSYQMSDEFHHKLNAEIEQDKINKAEPYADKAVATTFFVTKLLLEYLISPEFTEKLNCEKEYFKELK